MPALLVATLAAGCGGSSISTREPIGETRRAPKVDPARTTQTTQTTNAAANGSPRTVEERAAALHRRAIIVDGHNDIPTIMYGSNVDIDKPLAATHTDLPRLKASGYTGVFFSIYVEGDLAEKPTALGGGPLRRAIDLIDVTYRQVEKNPQDLVLATTTADIRRAKREGKIAVLMGVEGGHAIENSLGALRTLHRLGCRYMTLTHSNTNEWADSAGFSGPPVVRHHGLSEFGEEVVSEMQRLGMLVDISHVSDETFEDVMRNARAPVIASHSSARALASHRRNLTDDMLRALAKNDGVAMVNFWSLFLSNEHADASRAWFEKNGKAWSEIRARFKSNPLAAKEAIAKLRTEDPLPKVPLSVLVDHIDHMVKVAGIDHVGLGSDFDGVDALPEGLDGVESIAKITVELVRRGYKDEDILKILGENFLRVFDRTEAFARGTQTSISGHGSTRRIGEVR